MRAIINVISDFLTRLSPVREPVLFFGAFGLWVAAYHPGWVDTDPKKAFVAAAILWAQRSLSTPKKAADERVAAAAATTDPEVVKYVGALENQTAVLAGAQLGATAPPVANVVNQLAAVAPALPEVPPPPGD